MGAADARLVGIDAVSVRHAFVRKVYALLSVQLLITVGIGSVVMVKTEAIQEALGQSVIEALFYGCIVLSVVMLLVFSCCENLARTFPQNYILFFSFTVVESVVLGIVCSLYEATSVLVCFAITASTVAALTCFACQTKCDFTGWGPYLFAALMVLTSFCCFFMIASLLGCNE